MKASVKPDNPERALKRTRALVDAARLISASHDLDAILDELIAQATLLLGADVGVLHLVDTEGWLVVRRANPLAVSGSVFATEGARHQPGPHTRRTIRSRRPMVVDRRRGSAPTRALIKERFPTVQATVTLPLFAGDDLVGVLHLNWTHPHDITAEDLEVVEALGAHAAVAIRTAHLLEQTREEANRTTRAQAVTAELLQTINPAEIAAIVVREGRAVSGAHGSLVALLTNDGLEMEFVAAAGYPEAAVKMWQRFGVEVPVPLTTVLKTGEPIFIESRAEALRQYPALKDAYDVTQEGALAAIPLVVRGRAVGAYGVSFREDRRIDADQQGWLIAMAQRCSLALDRALLYDQVQRSDEGYRLIAEAAGAAMWDRDLETDRLTWSGGGVEVFGYTPEDLPDVKAWQEYVHPEDRERLRTMRRAAIDGGENRWEYEFRFLRADGSYASCLAVARVLRDETGRPMRMLGMCLDVTRSRLAEEERDRLSEALVRAEERERVAMDLHDGVIQQLFGASMLLQGLQRRTGALSEDANAALRTAVDALDSAHGTVRDYMEALRSPVLPQGRFGSQLEALAQDLRVTLGLRVDLRVDAIAEDTLPSAAGGEILQIAREAAANAVRHGKATTLRMRVRRSRDHFVLVMQDNGNGFDAKHEPQVPGRGLSNMTERARRLGGTLRVTSSPAHGADVRFELPLSSRVEGLSRGPGVHNNGQGDPTPGAVKSA
jgi:PAS domain S-box-containing protein